MGGAHARSAFQDGSPRQPSVSSEYDNMDLEMLQEVVPMLKQQLEKSMLDRNYVQLERVRIRDQETECYTTHETRPNTDRTCINRDPKMSIKPVQDYGITGYKPYSMSH